MLASLGLSDWEPKGCQAVVVGAGIGGLVAAACLARWGLRPLVLEAGSAAGGYLASFEREGATFDACVDAVGSVFEEDGSPGVLGLALEAAGVLEDVEWVPLDPIRVQRFPDFDLAVPRGLDRLLEQLAELFPESRFALRRALGELAAIHARARRALGLASRAEPALGFRDEPFGAFLARFPLSGGAAAALGSYATFLGVNPSEASTRAMADLWMSYVEGGAWRVRGGFGRLIQALVRRVKDAGGAVAIDCPVRSARRMGDGWRLSTGRGSVDAETVVWAAPPPPATHQKELSSSFVLLYALAEGEMNGLAASTGIFPTTDLEAFLRPTDPWGGAGGVSVALPAEGKAPAGLNPVVLHWPVVPSGLERVPRSQVEEFLEAKLERLAPGLRIRWQGSATPETLERYTRNPNGAAYGWAQCPDTITGPTGQDSGQDGLARAGQWAGLGGGVTPAALSGWRAAQKLAVKR